MSSKILKINGLNIDMTRVEMVGKVKGGKSWESYIVYLYSGNTIEIYQERKYADNSELLQMRREDFVHYWELINAQK